MLGLAFSLVTLAGGIAPLQDSDSPPPTPSQEAVERIDELDIAIEDYQLEWRKEQEELAKKYAEEAEKAQAEGREVSMPAMRMAPDFSRFITTLAEWADGSEGEDQALYLTRICTLGMYGEDSEGRKALDRLLEFHITSPSWARLGQMLPFLEYRFGTEIEGGLFGRLAANPDPDVRGWVAMSVHREALEGSDRDSEEYRVAREAVSKAAQAAKDEEVRDGLIGLIEVREKLGVGATAPDISGIDLDGVAFKLSDYTKQILFVDFWGDW